MFSIWMSYCILVFLTRGIDTQKLDGGDRLNGKNQGICESMDIRNTAERLEMLNNCTIVVGYLQIVLLEGYTSLNYSKYVFPQLREVTQFVLLYRVEGIHSLGQLFPNLALIRGQKLFHNYALVIFEIPQLREIGLRSLTVIQRGYVRIAQNPQLCYTKTLDWEKITGRSSGHYIRGNGPSSCPGSESCRGCDENRCWSSMHCQRLSSSRCHPECLGGCTPNFLSCYSCKHFTDDGVCVPSCPPDKFEHPATSICLTLKQCNKMYRGTGWIWERMCIRKCPKSYKMVFVNGLKTCEYCGNRCNVTCLGNEVETIDEIQYYKGCNFVNGSLHIKFIDDNNYSEDVMQELTDCFQDIQEIKGALKIYRSNSITSLNFLKNLTVIHGSGLMFDRYALGVHEMNNLQYLFDDEIMKKLRILNGTIFFHYNAKLCLKEIEKLRTATNTTVLPDDVSQISNGYESHCHFVNIQTEFKVMDSTTVTIIWDKISQPNRTKLQLGYLIYYIKEPVNKNLTHFSRDTCYENGWKSKYVEEPIDADIKRLNVNLTDLNPYTEYAYYVESYYKFTVMSETLHDGQSEIMYFKTDMDDPKMPVKIEACSTSSGVISVTWENDPTYNGVVTHHLIEVILQNDEKEHLDKRNYCVNPPIRETSVRNKESQTDIQEVNDKPKKTRKCYCTKDEWNKYVQDKSLLEATNKYLENSKNNLKSWCEKFHLKESQEMTHDFIIELKCQLLTMNYNEDEGNMKNEEDTLHSVSKRNANYAFDIQNIVGKATPRPPVKNVTINNIHHSFSTHSFGSHTNFSLGNLQHFGQYLIFVSACKGSIGDNCGPYTVIAHRTLSEPNKDNIDTLRVNKLSDNNVEIMWKEPPDPNGAILYYTLEYFNNDQGMTKAIVHCVTRKEHEDNKWKYHLVLSPGKYGIRVRAHSLARDADFIQAQYFSTELDNSVGWLIFLGVVMGICGFAGGFWWWYHNKRNTNHSDTTGLVSRPIAVRFDYGSDENLDRIDFYNMNT